MCKSGLRGITVIITLHSAWVVMGHEQKAAKEAVVNNLLYMLHNICCLTSMSHVSIPHTVVTCANAHLLCEWLYPVKTLLHCYLLAIIALPSLAQGFM